MPEFNGKPINVSLRIIADLSQGLYRSPADALKELVNNAYDADSLIVEINFSKDFSSLIIQDKGKGMTIDEFIQVMETIGGSTKRSIDTKHEDKTTTGRKIIGRIGIGLLGASQISNKIEFQSTTEDSTKGFKAYIEFDQFASEEAKKTKITDIWEKDEKVKIGNYYIKDFSGVDRAKHFTKVMLTQIKRVLVDKLKAIDPKTYEQPRKMGRKISNVKDLVNWMRKNGITKTALHEYDRIFWELCVLTPVPYINNALTISNKLETTSGTQEFTNFAKKINKETHLQLKFDGINCYKPILMPNDEDRNYPLFFNLLFMTGLNNKNIVYRDYNNTGKLEKKEFKVRGYIYFQRPKVWPPELQGLLIRVRNVAVGQYDSTFLTYRRHEGFKFSQITGEIYVDGLDDILNIDRSGFRETEPSFVAFRESIHNYLGQTVFPGIKEFATIERVGRRNKDIIKEEEFLRTNFSLIDNKKRELLFAENQKKLIERAPSKISFALSIQGKMPRFNKEYYRILTFLEAKLANKLSDEDRDILFEELIKWLNEFEHGH